MTDPPIIIQHAPEQLILDAIPASSPSVRLTSCRVDDPDQTTLYAFVQFGASPTYAECWAVTRAGAARFVGRTPIGWGKVDSATPEYFSDGTVRLSCSVAEPGASGSTSYVDWVDFPGALGDLGHEIRNTLYDRIRRVDSGASVILAERQAAALAPLREDIAALREQIEAVG